MLLVKVILPKKKNPQNLNFYLEKCSNNITKKLIHIEKLEQQKKKKSRKKPKQFTPFYT